MTVYKYAIPGAAAAGVALIAAFAGGARADRQTADGYKPAQAIVETFGSKQAVGYYTQKDGACAVTLVLSEAANDGESVPSGVRLRVNVRAGSAAELGSVEGQSLEVACGANAASVEVRRGNFAAAYVTQ